MPKAIAVLVGLTEIDLNSPAYTGWTNFDSLPGCQVDLVKMSTLLAQYKFNEVVTLSNEQATTENVLKYLKYRSGLMERGDLFLFYFTGHGIQIDDPSRTEKGGFDDAICCFNGPVIDLELGEIWKKVRPGVRIVMLSDSCHSGTNAAIFSRINAMRAHFMKTMSIRASSALVNISEIDIKAMLIHYGACDDKSKSAATDMGSPFTIALYKCLIGGGNFRGNYPSLCEAIRKITQAEGWPQVAQYNELGPKNSLAFNAFRNQKPLTIDFPKELLPSTLHSAAVKLSTSGSQSFYSTLARESKDTVEPIEEHKNNHLPILSRL